MKQGSMTKRGEGGKCLKKYEASVGNEASGVEASMHQGSRWRIKKHLPERN